MRRRALPLMKDLYFRRPISEVHLFVAAVCHTFECRILRLFIVIRSLRVGIADVIEAATQTRTTIVATRVSFTIQKVAGVRAFRHLIYANTNSESRTRPKSSSGGVITTIILDRPPAQNLISSAASLHGAEREDRMRASAVEP